MKEAQKNKVTEEQKAAWKQKHGTVFVIHSEGLTGYLKDPLSDLKVMKMAYNQIGKSKLLFVATIINNCWLGGDEELKNNERYSNGLEHQIDEITDIPQAEVRREGNKYIIEVDEYICEVRAAKRADILEAEQKNAAKEPFETSIHLLKLIALNGVDEIKKSSTRAYIGLLAAIDKVKDKAVVRVEKL